ncbi:MAG: polynucleotide adenylyltransferase PcnB [Acidiferrobacterales bacterium]
MIIPRAEHSISRTLISDNALKVLYRLRDAGYASLLVGGCVRDLMLGHEPKDFDVVTDARPEQIQEVFRNARLIGRRFRLAHIHFGREIIEVATFRGIPVADAENPETDVDDAEDVPAPSGRRPERGAVADHNIFGSQEEDAVRRDFTVNALYYNIRDFTVMDYVGGVQDLKQGIMRMIGDPRLRYREDPVRMLRLVRFAAKLGFRIESATAESIRELGHLLLEVSPARMFEEVLKLFHGGYAAETYELLRHYDLFRFLFPATDESLALESEGYPRVLLSKALESTDARMAADKPVNPAFLFGAFLWEPVRLQMGKLIEGGASQHDALHHASEAVLHDQLRHISIPKRFSFPMREIWDLQMRLTRRGGRNAMRLLEHKRFRAAYDFLVLRAHAGEADAELAEWWTRFQEVLPEERIAMVRMLTPTAGGQPKRRRRRRRTVPRESG